MIKKCLFFGSDRLVKINLSMFRGLGKQFRPGIFAGLACHFWSRLAE